MQNLKPEFHKIKQKVSHVLNHTTGGIGNGCEEAPDEGIHIDAGIQDGIDEDIPCEAI